MRLRIPRCAILARRSPPTGLSRTRGVSPRLTRSGVAKRRRPEKDRYVPFVKPERDPGGVGSPRGPPMDCQSRTGDEAARSQWKAPRMAATTRGSKIQNEVSGSSLSHDADIIKTPLTTDSREYVDGRADRSDPEASLPTRHARPIGDERQCSFPMVNACWCGREPSQATNPNTSTNRTSLSREARIRAVTPRPCTQRTNFTRQEPGLGRRRPSEAKKGKLAWSRQQHRRPRLRHREPRRRQTSNLKSWA